LRSCPPEKNHAYLFGREVLDQLIEFGGVLVEHHVVATFFFFKVNRAGRSKESGGLVPWGSGPTNMLQSWRSIFTPSSCPA
jgi:hypothetical protein